MTAVGITIGAVLLAFGLIDRHRAELLLFDRWRSAEPAEWARALKPARRMFPFSMVIRYHVVSDRLRLWHFSTPEWARRDDVAMRALRRVRVAPFIATMGIVIAWITIANAA